MLKTQSMNLGLVRTFVVVGQSKDLTDAASKLNLDQSNVSRHIKTLEETLGTKLITRNQRVFELTDDGKKVFELYSKAYNTLLLTEKTLLQDKSVDSGKLTIGVSEEIEKDIVNEKIKSFKLKYPNVTIKIVNGSTKELIDKLSQYYFDFIIDIPIENSNKSKGYKSDDFYKDKYCIAYSSKYFNNELKSISDVKNVPLILPVSAKNERKMFDTIIDKDDYVNNLTLEVDNYYSALDFIESGLGYGLIPKRFIKNKELNYLDIDMVKNIAISYVEDNLSESAKMFLQEFLIDENNK